MQDSDNYELDPNFAVVCSFLNRFGKFIDGSYAGLSIEDLKEFLEAKRVDEKHLFVKLHLSLLRFIGNKCKTLDWMKGIIKFCKDFPDGDDVLIKEKGYTNVPVSVKLRVLKNLCEDQFEYNDRFNKLVNGDLVEGNNLRHVPLGKDKLGRAYWLMEDGECGMRLFRGWYNELTEDETWNIVCSELDGLESLIETLEENADLKQDDPSLPKSLLRSHEKNISPTDIIKTAKEEAANAVYFTKSSPLFYKAPKLRSKKQIFKDEAKYHLPHCDLVLNRVCAQYLDRYLRPNSSPKVGENDRDKITKDPESDLKPGGKESLPSESESEKSETNDVEVKIESESEIKLQQNKTNVNPYLLDSCKNCKDEKVINDKLDQSKSGSGENEAKISKSVNSCIRTDIKAVGEDNRERRNSPNIDTGQDSLPSSDRTLHNGSIETASAKAANETEMDERYSKDTCDIVRNHKKDVVKNHEKDIVKNHEKEVKSHEKSVKNPGKESKNHEKEKKETEVIEVKKYMIGCKGDADSVSDDDFKGCDNKKEVAGAYHSNQKSENCESNDAKSSESDSRDEKDVFDNAIKDLIRLEQTSFSDATSEVVDITNVERNGLDINSEDKNSGKERKDSAEKELHSKIDNGKEVIYIDEIDDDKKVIDEIDNDKKVTDKLDNDKKVTDEIDNDKKVIDDALKDLIQLEELASKLTPPSSTCMSPVYSGDANQCRVTENVEASSDKGDSTHTLDTKTSSEEHHHVAQKEEKIDTKSVLKHKCNDENSMNDDIKCKCEGNETESNERKLVSTNETPKSTANISQNSSQSQNGSKTVENKAVESDTKLNSVKQEPLTKTKDVVNKGELPFSDFENIVMNMINADISITDIDQYDKKGRNLDEKEKVSESASKDSKQVQLKSEHTKDEIKEEKDSQYGIKVEGKKKEMSMVVDGEIIHIEEASDNSETDSDTGSTSTKSSANDSTTEMKTDKSGFTSDKAEGKKTSLSAKVQEIIENNAKVVSLPVQSLNLNQDFLPKIVTYGTEKDVMKSLYLTSTNGEKQLNSSNIQISHTPQGSKSQKVIFPQAFVNKPMPLLGNVKLGSTPVHSVVGKTPTVVNISPLSKTSLTSALQTVYLSPIVSGTSSANTFSILPQNVRPKVLLQAVSAGNTVKGPTSTPLILLKPNQSTQTPNIVQVKPGAPKQQSLFKTCTPQKTWNPQDIQFFTSINASHQTKGALVSLLQSKSLASTVITQSIAESQQKKVALASLLQPKSSASTVVTQSISAMMSCQAAAKGESQDSDDVKNVVIVVGPDGKQYDKATGKPFVYPSHKKLVVAGPRGKYYDQATGYEVTFPKASTVQHIPGKVYLASNVTYPQEVLKQMKGKTLNPLKETDKGTSSGQKKPRKKNKKKVTYMEESDTSEEEFLKMLESGSEKSNNDEGSDDQMYDYEKISQRVKAAQTRKLSNRKSPKKGCTEDGVDTDKEEEEVESEEETVPLVLGRNAKRVAARRSISYTEPCFEVVEEEPTMPCTVCATESDPASILLCDKCDEGYHMWCLSPPLPFVPLEDWFCPKCEQGMLIEKLKEKLTEMRKAQKRYHRKLNSNSFLKNRISQKTVSINTENIVTTERRSCRGKKEVNYNEESYDKMLKKAVHDYNKSEKSSKKDLLQISDSDTDAEGTSKLKESQHKVLKRPRKGERTSRRLKKTETKVKKRKLLTGLETDKSDSGSSYVQSEHSSSPDSGDDTADQTADQEDTSLGGAYFTASGRQTKHISYTT